MIRSMIYRNVLYVFLLVVAMIVGIVWLIFAKIQSNVTTAQWIIHTAEVLKMIDATESDRYQSVAHTHAFVLTGDTMYLELAQASKAEALHNAARLESLITDNPEQWQRVISFNDLLRKRLNFIEHQLTNHQDNGLPAYISSFDTAEFKNSLKEFRTLSNAIKLEERNLLTQRQMQADQSIQQVYIVLIILSVLILMLFAYMLIKIRQEIEAHQHTLKDRDDLIVTLEVAKKEADSANAAKSAFLAMMSHEIRTPMNAVKGMLELIQMTPLNDEQAKMLTVIAESSNTLLHVVNDVLDFSKIEAGHLEIHPHPAAVQNDIDTIIQIYHDHASRKGVLLHSTIDPTTPTVVYWDQLRIRQIISNLVSNAIKFTNRGEIEIHVSAVPLESNKVNLQIDVIDSGIGIEEKDLAKLFQPFIQVDMHTARRFGGSGLGLAICRRLVDLMHGELRLHSVRGKGTTATLTIPVTTGSVSDLPSAVSTPVTAIPEHEVRVFDPILICDDNALNRNVVARQLAALGYATDMATEGREALAKWRQGRYSLILLDVQMPHIDGYTVSRHIRTQEMAEPERIRIPILAYTANVLPEERERCLASGMDDLIYKPSDLYTLRNKIAFWLEEKNTASASLPTEIGNIIDYQRLHRICDGNSNFMRDILLDFVTEAQTGIQQLAALIRSGDLSAVARQAHRLKGAAHTAAAESLAAICSDLETFADRGDYAAVSMLEGRLLEEFEVLRHWIEDRYCKDAEKGENDAR